MNITVNATVDSHTIAYCARTPSASFALAAGTGDSFSTVVTSGGHSVEIPVSVNRKAHGTDSRATSVPSIVDPTASRSSLSTLAAGNGSKRGKRAAISQWDS